MNLRESYGTENFSYPKTITVQMGEKTKRVVYRGESFAAAAPQAFVMIEGIIEGLAEKRLQPRSGRNQSKQ